MVLQLDVQLFLAQQSYFFALLDSVSRVIKSKYVRRPSVGRSSVRLWHRLVPNLLHKFLSNFSYCFRWPICLYVFEFLKTKCLFRCFSIVLFNMEPYRTKNFKMLLLLQIAAEGFQTFPEFSSQWSTQNYVLEF